MSKLEGRKKNGKGIRTMLYIKQSSLLSRALALTYELYQQPVFFLLMMLFLIK